MKCVWITIFIFAHSSVYAFENQLVRTFGYVQSIGRITNQCNDTLALYLQNLISADDPWALKMFDATSKIPVGVIFSYNFGELGQFKQCLETESKDGLIEGKYCLGYLSIDISSITNTNINLSDIHQQIHLRKTARRITNAQVRTANNDADAGAPWAICLPRNCTDGDAREILLNLIGSPVAYCQTKDDISPPLTNGAIATVFVLSFFATLLVVSTIYDLYYIHINTEPPNTILVAYSVYRNGRKLFRTSKNSDELSCLNGIKFLSMLWVLIGHIFSVYTGGMPILNFVDIIKWADSLQSMIIVGANFSVDSFFLVGGALVVYGFMKVKHNGIKFNIFHFYLHRYLRLTPPLAAAVLVSANLLVYMGSGPLWLFIDSSFQQPCQKYWWSTLLYIQNYINTDELCIGQTWYLSIDMQLYILSPLILFPLWKYPKIGLTLIASCIIVFIIVPFYVAYDKELSGILSTFYVKASAEEYLTSYYYKTHTRAASWIMGTLLGYVLAKIRFTVDNRPKELKIGKILVIFLWAICMALTLTCIFGGHSTLRGEEYDRWGNAFYIALVRPVWCLCLSWIILACVLGYGGPVNVILSFPIYQILNRFAYSVYILHLTILYMIALAAKSGVYFSSFNMVYSFWGLTMFSFGLSILWVLAFESPMIVIEKLIFEGINKAVSYIGGKNHKQEN